MNDLTTIDPRVCLHTNLLYRCSVPAGGASSISEHKKEIVCSAVAQQTTGGAEGAVSTMELPATTRARNSFRRLPAWHPVKETARQIASLATVGR